MAFYNRLQMTAVRLLEKYGQPVVLRQLGVGGGTYDPATGRNDVAPGGYVETTRRAITTDAPGKRVGPSYGQTNIAATLIQDADKWVYMDGLGVAPRLQDRLVVGGLEYVIIDVQVTNPGGLALMYLLVLRT